LLWRTVVSDLTSEPAGRDPRARSRPGSGRMRSLLASLPPTTLRLGAAAVLLLLSGCGGAAARPLTEVQLRAQIGAICREESRKASLIEPFGARSDPATVAKLRAVDDEEVERLSALVPPRRTQDAWGEQMKLLRRLGTVVFGFHDARATHDAQRTASLNRRFLSIEAQIRRAEKRKRIVPCGIALPPP
jgi:hypothetical protein